MISFVYITNRKSCQIQWFFDSLNLQLVRLEVAPQAFEVIVVDQWAEVQEGWTQNDVDQRKWQFCEWCELPARSYLHVPIKPNVWLGPHRLTKNPYFAASSTRNTGLCYASGNQICYVDDLSLLLYDWLEEVILSEQGNYVACGTYQKVNKMVVKNGHIVTCEDIPNGYDTRLPQLASQATVPCSGGWAYGCSISIPTEELLKINGWDEDCDSSGFEDCSCGFRLQRNGSDIRISPRMRTLEADDLHNQGTPAMRIIKPYPGWKDSSCFMENYFKFGDRIVAPNYCDYRDLRQKILAGEPFPIPTGPQTDWRDGAFLRDM